MKPTEQRRTGGHVRPAGWHGLQSFGRPSNHWAAVNWATQLWLLSGQCWKCDIPTVLTKYLWEYIVHYFSLCEDHRCLFIYAMKFAHIFEPHRLSLAGSIGYLSGLESNTLGLLTFKIRTIYPWTHPTIQLTVLQFQRHHFISAPATMSTSRCSRTMNDAGARTVFGSRAFCHAAPTIWNSLHLLISRQ